MAGEVCTSGSGQPGTAPAEPHGPASPGPYVITHILAWCLSEALPSGWNTLGTCPGHRAG